MEPGDEWDVDGLLAKVRGGQPDAFAGVIGKYQRRIHRFCYWMLGDRLEAEDALQEIFFKAYLHLESYRYDGSFGTWLYAIASNHCRSLLRRKQRWRLLMPLLGGRSEEKSAEAVYSGSAESQLELLQGLSAKEKEILILRVFEDRSFEDIGRLLGSSAAAARKRFERVRAKVKEQRIREGEKGYGHRYELQ
ncbi:MULTISPECIES: RNA polymerase sigma factor [Paenibacillus]|uniref:RNA polymerase sigma factor n=1 Tax=Paenibacillus TaxID=44249 RepID=UPI0022B8CD0F|nr:sigma-70 family RNA polymerase sigma factor [Paenibacillus caseinilyticus]MCZ8519210.1 sigma-70 family RNA polymerase sigma factor [Paenibacillus caseinilyticus]